MLLTNMRSIIIREMSAAYSITPTIEPPRISRGLWFGALISIALHTAWLLKPQSEVVINIGGVASVAPVSIALMQAAVAPEERKPVAEYSPKNEVVAEKLPLAEVKPEPIDEIEPPIVPEVDVAAEKPRPVAQSAEIIKQTADEPVLPAETNPVNDQQAVDEVNTLAHQTPDLARRNPSFSETPVAPKYPPLAIKRRWQGEALIQAWVSAAGITEKVQIKRSSGFELLDKAALAAVKNWRFTAFVDRGTPIASWVEVPVDFTLRR